MAKDFGPGGGFDDNPLRYFGQMSRGYDQKTLDVSTVQLAPLGAMREYMNGNVFRYARAAAAIPAATIVANDVLTAANAGPGLVETDGIATAAAIGATQVTLTSAALASVAAEYLVGGHLCITDDAGEGYQYPIVQNTAASSSAVTLTLDERFPLKIALTTATDVAIVPHPCHEMITCTIATDAIPRGVAPTVVADNEYFWMQTKGNGLCIAEGTIGLGDDVWLSDTTDGAVATPAGTAVGDLVTEARVGVANFAPDSTGHVSVALGLSGW